MDLMFINLKKLTSFIGINVEELLEYGNVVKRKSTVGNKHFVIRE